MGEVGPSGGGGGIGGVGAAAQLVSALPDADSDSDEAGGALLDGDAEGVGVWPEIGKDDAGVPGVVGFERSEGWPGVGGERSGGFGGGGSGWEGAWRQKRGVEVWLVGGHVYILKIMSGMC